MKTFLTRTLSFVACVLIAACTKNENTETAAVEPPAPPEATPAPVQPVAAATPAPKRLAPEGTFFLLAKKSVETPDGIFGLVPGTKVQRHPDGKYWADGHVLELQDSEITNDLDIAARYAGADQRAQAAIKQTLQPNQSPAGAPKPGTPGGAARPSSTASAPAPSSTSSPGGAARSSGALLGNSNLGNSALGTTHTKIQNGWIYEKDGAGNWIQMRPAR